MYSVCLVAFTPEATDVIPLTLLINIARMCVCVRAYVPFIHYICRTHLSAGFARYVYKKHRRANPWAQNKIFSSGIERKKQIWTAIKIVLGQNII